MNVLEHIEDDAATLQDFAQVLPPVAAGWCCWCRR